MQKSTSRTGFIVSPNGEIGYRKNPSSTQWVIAHISLAPAARKLAAHRRCNLPLICGAYFPASITSVLRYACATMMVRLATASDFFQRTPVTASQLTGEQQIMLSSQPSAEWFLPSNHPSHGADLSHIRVPDDIPLRQPHIVPQD